MGDVFHDGASKPQGMEARKKILQKTFRGEGSAYQGDDQGERIQALRNGGA